MSRTLTRYTESGAPAALGADYAYVGWTCGQCGEQVRRYRWQSDVDCAKCGACYNAGGQRLRDDWRSNPSCYDSEIGDLEGFEQSQLRAETYGGRL